MGKTQIKMFCQQYTQYITRQVNTAVSQLESDILEIVRALGGQGSMGEYGSLKERKQRLGSLPEEVKVR